MSSEEPTSSPFTPVPEQTPQEKRERLIREVLDHASSGNLSPFVEAIVSGKLDVDQMDSRGYTAIHLAVWRLDMQSVLTLLDKASCPVDLQSGTGQTPLMLATVKGSLQMIKLFLDRGADIEFKDTLGISPIICAAQSGQLGPFYALLHRGAKIDVRDRNGCDIVHWAAYKNQIQMLHVLKAMNLELEPLDTAKMTPLHRAAMSNAIDSIDFLLFNNVASDKIDEKKGTALDIAIENCSEGSAKILASYSVEEEPIHTYFFFWCTLYWVGIYYVYYDYVLPATVMNLFPSLVFNISVLWLLPIYL
jgi:ankyrin repeat protein